MLISHPKKPRLSRVLVVVLIVSFSAVSEWYERNSRARFSLFFLSLQSTPIPNPTTDDDYKDEEDLDNKLALMG